MSKYAVKYLSSSKGTVDIEDMATPHLLNAWRKMRDRVLKGEVLDPSFPEAMALKAMSEEITARGGAYDGMTDKWTMPPKDAPCPDCGGTGQVEGRYGASGPLTSQPCEMCAPGDA